MEISFVPLVSFVVSDFSYLKRARCSFRMH